MRQNCLPQTVYRASSTQMISVAIAAIAQACASHISDAQSSFPQSRVGVKSPVSDSIPATYRGKLGQRRGRLNCGGERLEPPLAAADEFQLAGVELLDGGAVTHADQNHVG